MKINLPITIGYSAALAFLLVACTQPAPIEASSPDKIDPSHLETLIDDERNLFFLDVRTPEEFAATLRQEMAKWAKVIKDAGIKAE